MKHLFFILQFQGLGTSHFLPRTSHFLPSKFFNAEDDAGEKELIQQTNKLADERWTKLKCEHPELAKQAIQWAEEYKQNLESELATE